jgi:hypothetical protein
MRRLLVPAIVLVVLGLMPSANANNITWVHKCNNYYSGNGNAGVMLCVYAYQDNTIDRVWVRFLARHINGFQDASQVGGTLRDWTSRNGSDPWCDGVAPGCTGGGDNSVLAGVPITLNTSELAPTQHYCSQHGEADMDIFWPAGGLSSPDFNSPTTDTIGAGCTL